VRKSEARFVAPRRLRTSIFAFPSFIGSSQKSHHIFVRTPRMDTAREFVAKKKHETYSTVSG
jgi:hypothetical protein